jgi:hypothetical protein
VPSGSTLPPRRVSDEAGGREIKPRSVSAEASHALDREPPRTPGSRPRRFWNLDWIRRLGQSGGVRSSRSAVPQLSADLRYLPKADFGFLEIRARSACHQWPVLGIEVHGSLGGSGAPFCNNSMDCLSGERTNAITPSRGGRLMVTPAFINCSQVA